MSDFKKLCKSPRCKKDLSDFGLAQLPFALKMEKNKEISCYGIESENTH